MIRKINCATNIQRTLICSVKLLLLVLLATWTATAQLPTATILGEVKDSSGAVVAGANLTARSVETGQTRTTVSAGDGSYRFSALPVGGYELRVEHPGFQSEVRSGLTLVVSQEAVVNITLQVGGVEQTVSVTGEAPLVNTTSGSLGGLVSEERVADLPLNGRNYIDLTLLQAGVVQQKTVYSVNVGVVGTYFSSNGATVRSNNYMLDGAILTDIIGSSSASVSSSTLGVDGIREYRVITNSFGAEYGMTMGSQMVAVSKGGTNIFHGDLFEYLRNSALDARNYFDYGYQRGGPRLPPFQRNNFGGSVGGPIKKDKTFFYGVFEGVRERLGLSLVNTVPGASCHNATNIVDKTCDATLAAGATEPVAAVIQPLLALYPSPNLPNLNPNLPANRYTFPFTMPTTDNYGQMRVDQIFSARDTFFVRYTIQDTTRLQVEQFPQFTTPANSRNQFTTLSETHVFSSNLLNTFRFSLSRTLIAFFNSPADPIGAGISLVAGWPLGPLTVGGITQIGANNNTPMVRKQNIFTYSDDMFYTRGRNSIKFGTLINHYQQQPANGSFQKGSLAFGNLTNFILGKANSEQALAPGSPSTRDFHFNTLGFYVQDDFRARSNLTLNLGLRYEFNTVPQEQHGQWAHMDDPRTSAVFTVSPAFYVNPSLKNFSPRLGFAWDVKGDGKTAVRGGLALLYDIAQATGAIGFSSLTGNPPWTQGFLIANPASITIPLTGPTGALAPREMTFHPGQEHLLQYNLALERQLPFQMALTVAYAGSKGYNLFNTTEGNPTVPQIVNGVQFWPAGATRVNPNFPTTSITFFDTQAQSWYNALQVELVKHMSKGLQLQSSYTWSHLMDNGVNAGQVENNYSEGPGPVDPNNLNLDRSNSPYDSTQVWKLNAIYRFPGVASSHGFAGKVLNGWWISGIMTLQSGFPFSPVLNANRSRSGVEGGVGLIDRPDLVPGTVIKNITHGNSVCPGALNGTPLGTSTLYYDPCAFSLPTIGYLGNTGRNILRGPGFAGLDFSIVKDTAIKPLGESGKLEFRTEVFNITNRSNFNNPNRTVFAASPADTTEAPLSNAGQITSTVGTSRQIQFALKLLF